MHGPDRRRRPLISARRVIFWGALTMAIIAGVGSFFSAVR
jgi:hypothetical protein